MIRKIRFLSAFWVLTATQVFGEDETSSWEFSAGISGTETTNTGSGIETFYWGPFLRTAYLFSDEIKARLALRHTRNKFLYDGLGGISRQSQTSVSPGLSWDLSEKISLDAEYHYRFGENSFQEHAGTLAAEYLVFSFLRLSFEGGYNQQNFVFPNSGAKVSQRAINLTFEPIILISKRIELPLVLNYLNSRYTTNKTIYTATTASPGMTFRSAGKFWGFTFAGIIGSDSSGYLMYGGEIRLRLNIMDRLAIRISGGLTQYHYSADTSAKNKKLQGETLSPLGNSDTFNIASVGTEVAYAF